MRIYVILDTENVTGEILIDCIQSSENTLRKSVDGTKTILKYDKDTPAWAESLTKYTHDEILGLMQGNQEWETEEEV